MLERFFDEAGGMQLVIHSPFGSRINRAWGLALRKRFCRRFNFELQAAATEDNIVLSLTTAHSFELADVAQLSAFRKRAISCWSRRCSTHRCSPRAGAGWRASHLRCRGSAAARRWRLSLRAWRRRTWSPACSPTRWPARRTLAGDREIPDHPLTNQTIADCLHEAMDIEGLERLLAAHRSLAISAWLPAT